MKKRFKKVLVLSIIPIMIFNLSLFSVYADNEQSTNSIDSLIQELPGINQSTPADYFWYLQLADFEKVIYQYILGFVDDSDEVEVSGLNSFSEDEIKDSIFFAFSAAKADHPWVSAHISDINIDFDEIKGVVVIGPEYNSYSSYQFDKARARLTQIVKTAGDEDRYIQIRNIATYVNRHIAYDWSALFSGMNVHGGASYNIMGGLIWNQGVCTGLSYQFKAVCDELNIPCIVIEGFAGEGLVNHVWNAVLMEDQKWYLVDCTKYTKGEDYKAYEILANADLESTYQKQGLLHYSGLYTKYYIPDIASLNYRYSGVYDESLYNEADFEFEEQSLAFSYEALDENNCKITHFEGSPTGDINIPSQIDGYNVSVIGAYIFANETGFDGNLVLPDTVKEIEEYAFFNCNNLIGDLVLPQGLKIIGRDAFAGCIKLGGNKDLVLPNSLETIGTEAFDSCNSFSGTINIPKNISSISRVFEGCRGISAFSINADNPDLCEIDGVVYSKDKKKLIRWPIAKSGKIEFQDGVQYIDECAFAFCQNTEGELILPDTLKEIGNAAFYMTGIKGNLVIPNSVAKIGEFAFTQGEDSYTGEELRGFGGTLTLGDDVKYIGEQAFRDCIFNGELHLPSNISFIGNLAFSNCGFSGSFVIPKALTDIGDEVFSCNNFTGDLFIPDTVKTIGDHAFGSCTFDGSLTISEGVKRIEEYAFDHNSFHGELIIPSTLSDVGEKAFQENSFSSVKCSCGFNCENRVIQEATYIPFVWGYSAFVCPNCDKMYMETDIRPEGSWEDLIEHKPEDEMMAVSLDEVIDISIDTPYTYSYCRFSPDKTGLYQYKSITPESQGRPAKNCFVYDSNWNAFNLSWYKDDGNFQDEVILEKGQTYYFVSGRYDLECCNYGFLLSLIKGISLNKNTIDLAIGDSELLTAIIYPDDLTEETVLWESNDTSIATVDENGLIIPVSEGTATISAFLANDTRVFENCIVNVTPEVNHDWNTATYAWSEDHSTCKATRVCRNNALHIETATAMVSKSTVAASCTEAGKTTYTAAFSENWCVAQTAETTIPATGHNWDSGKVTKAATCTEAGMKTFTCQNDPGHTKTETIPATGHKLVKTESKAASCESAGNIKYWTCTSCEKLFKDSEEKTEITKEDTVIPATGHKWSDWTVTKPATATETGNESRTCENCGENETREIPVKPSENPFSDVKDSDYFFDPVLWAVNHDPQITKGTSDTTFGPAAPCTRGQAVTFLWRACGCEKVTDVENPFTDVKSSDYFYDAVLWAYKNKITTGTTATTFGPNETCNRGQIVTFLWRSQGEPKSDASIDFTDVADNAYYYAPVRWAVEKQITKGTTDTTFSPNDSCSRGQIVTFLYRAVS